MVILSSVLPGVQSSDTAIRHLGCQRPGKERTNTQPHFKTSPLPPSPSIAIGHPPHYTMASMSPINTAVGASGASSSGGSVSPRQAIPPKNVAFELLFPDSPQRRARLPMRVQIFPHDATDSIVTTVKNFYGLYSGPTGSKGVSFEDQNGNTLIARYENFHNNMIVYVRVIDESPSESVVFGPQEFQPSPVAEQAYFGANGFAAESVRHYGQDIARPESTASLRRSPSPNASRGRRSVSAGANGKKARSRSVKNRGSSQGDDTMNGYSSGDGAPSSHSSKNKEHLGNTDISVENIVEGGRRKRAKFESSVSALIINLLSFY